MKKFINMLNFNWKKGATCKGLRSVVFVLSLVLGVGTAWAGSSDYARGYATVSSSSPSGAGKVYVAATTSGGAQPSIPGSTSSSWKTPEATAKKEGTSTTFDFYYYSLPATGYAIEGWSETDGASDYSNAAIAKYSITTSSSSLNDAYTDVRLYAHFVPVANVKVTFLTPDPKCTYTVKCDGADVAVGSSKTTNKPFDFAVTVNDAGYKLLGWYTTTDGGVTKSYFSPNVTFKNKYFSQACSVGVDLVEANKPVFMVGDKLFTDLNAANSAASSGTNKSIVLVSDGVMDAGNYTISSGNTLLIPHTIGSTFVNSKSVVDAPYIVRTATSLSAFRKLTLQDGVKITVSGTICVAGKMMSSGGGKASAYPTGELGVIDMSTGGNITLNSGAKLYAWGFIKGQDKDQGNNTGGCGSITAKSGSVVWEGFATGDWRGGTASSTIYSNASSWKFFPFQSYTIQNIEVPVTYNYGSTLSNYMSIFGDGQVYNGTFSLVGKTSGKVLFLLKDSASKLKKWYNPQTDLVCYEMSGTTQLDALNVDAAGETVSSDDYNLPISTSMHIILASNTTITKPVEIQAGAVIEIKSGVTATCESNVFMFDKDQWGEYCNSKYYYTMTNLSSHKNRGDGKSNEMIDDAKFIVDGTLNVTGTMYTTTGGADIMGNGGGSVTFSNIGAAGNIVMCTGVATNENVARNQACLHNEDGSYTRPDGAGLTYHNVNGRWFVAADKDEKANHTYNFKYLGAGQPVSGVSGTDTTTPAVYSNDKTGLENRLKWANVTADASCADWWKGQGDQSTWFYNYTTHSAWHQYKPTEMENVYSCSDNKLYEKDACVWGEIGDVDENCLYTIGATKKALVDGHFLELVANNNDPAYHLASDATKYYLCFSGCNWHEATKYEGESKAYVVDGGIYIWYNGDWLNVERQEPFFYTLEDETNAMICYEYLNSEWQIATPYVRVTSPSDPTRELYFFSDAVVAASTRKNATKTLLRDFSETAFPITYTASNTTCTLDLNGHTAEITVVGAGTTAVKMIDINAANTTFTITDNSEGANGELRLIAAPNTDTKTQRWYGIYLTDGALVLDKGKIYVEDNFRYVKTADTGMASAIAIAAGKSFTMNDGAIDVYATYAAYGVQVNGSATLNATVNIKGGTIHAETTYTTTAYGMVLNGGTTTVTGGRIEAKSKTTTAIGIYLGANKAGYYGTLNFKGGEVDALSITTNAYGVQVSEAIAYSSDNVISSRVVSKATISGGTIRATSTTTKSSSHTVGVRSFGTTSITGGTIECIATQSFAYGVYAVSGTLTVSGSPTIIARAPTNAYGACAGLTPVDKTGAPYNGSLVIKGGRFEVTATTSTGAYGVLVQALGRAVNYSTSSGYYPGNYVSVGSATISGGEFDVESHTTTAYGLFVKGAFTQSGAKLDADGNLADPVTSDSPTCTVTGGKFKTSGTGSVYASNNAGSATTYKITGGYYSHNSNLEGYAVSPKHVLPLADDDANRPDYKYKVAESYTVTFMNGSESLQSTYQEVGKTPVYDGETPTKASTTSESYIFDGWSTTDGGAVVSPLPNVTSAGATYYAHYNTTTLKYIVTLDATTNGGSCTTDKIYVEPSAAVGTLPTATKTGFTFNGWYTAASGGTKLETTTAITADGTYYAQFTKNNYTLKWVLDGGKVTTAGKYGSTSWPAKNATGTQSKAIPYASTLTAPVVTKTGYTFSKWSPLVASTMPAEAATYTAIWTPATNTAYTVKHYLLNVDGTCPATPFETESLTGTTGTSVTPAVKPYDGFIAPATQTKTIAADGSMVIEYQYTRMHYTFILDAATNGGTSEVPSIEVIHGATIGTVPPDAVNGCKDFIGWFTKAVGGVKITSDFLIEYDMKKLYAQFSDDVRTWPITYLAGANGSGTVAADTKTCGVDKPLSSSTFTRTGYTQTGWSTTDGGEKAYDLGGSYTGNAALTLYPFWTINTHTLTWDWNGGATSSTTHTTGEVAYGTEIVYPADNAMAKELYAITGWSPDATTMPDEDLTITAQWTPAVASVTVGSSTTYYATIDAAFAFANEQTADMEIKLMDDVSASASLAYTAAANCTLDLNNYTISGTISKLIDVNAAGQTFTIDDKSEAKGGKVSTYLSTNARLYALFISAGTVNLKKGTIYSENPHTYSSASANKSSAASAVYVTAGCFLTMDDGTVESKSQYSSYAIYVAQSTVSTVTINGGLVKGQTTSSSTAGGIYNLSKGLTINGGKIVGHSRTSSSYGIYLNGGSVTVNGGEIEATNDTIDNKGTSAAYGIYAKYNKSGYTGVITIPSTSTVKVLAKARTTSVYPICIDHQSATGSKIEGGTFTAKSITSSTAAGVYTLANLTISGGTFNVSTETANAFGVYARGGTTTVNGNPVFNVTSGTTTAIGAYAYGYVNAKGTVKTAGTINVNGGTYNVTSTTTTAYGAYSNVYGLKITQKGTVANDTIFGQHYMAGTITITDGTFNVKATTTTAYGLVVASSKKESGAAGTSTKYPRLTAKGGKFKVTSSGDENATAYATNTLATASYMIIQGGKFNTKRTNATETSNLEDKYTAPTKSCNYWVLDLPESELPYKYEVAEAYKITFKNGETTLQEGAVKKGETPVYSGETPTKDPDESSAYTFDGWSATDGGDKLESLPAVTAATTYYAHYSTVPTVAQVTSGSETKYYTLIDDAFNYASTCTAAVTIKLLRDATPATMLIYDPVPAVKCTLDLNNHAINGAIDATVLSLRNSTGKTSYTDIYIVDNSAEKGGKISNKFSKNSVVYCISIKDGYVRLYLQSGTIEAINTRQSTGSDNVAAYAVNVASNSTRRFYLQGGRVQAYSSFQPYGIVTYGTCSMTGGEIYVSDQVPGLSLTPRGKAFGVYCTHNTFSIGDATKTPTITVACQSIAYGLYVAGKQGTAGGTTYNGTVTVNNGAVINATTTDNSAYGAYVSAAAIMNTAGTAYNVSKGKLITNGGTFNVTAGGNSAYGVYVSRIAKYDDLEPRDTTYVYNPYARINGGTFNVTSETKNAYGVLTVGRDTISGGTFNVRAKTTYAVGIFGQLGYTVIDNSTGTLDVYVRADQSNAMAIKAGDSPNSKSGAEYKGEVKVSGGTFTVVSDSLACGPYAGGGAIKITTLHSSNSSYYAGTYASTGTLIVDGGTYNVTARKNAKAVSALGRVSIAKITTPVVSPAKVDTTHVTVNGGFFNVHTTGDDPADASNYLAGSTAVQKTFLLHGGYYTSRSLYNSTATKDVTSMYVHPASGTGDWRILPLRTDDPNYPTYKYKIAEAYDITFNNWDDSALQTDSVEKGTIPAYYGEAPTREATAQYTYTFTGWSPTVAEVTGNATYTAQFDATVNNYTVTWQNYDGTPLETDTEVPYGTMPTYNGETPTRDATAQYTYTFTGWSPTVAAVTGDVTYIAQFEETLNTYTVTWKNWDDSQLEYDASVAYGATPSYDGATPTKPEDATNTYTFSGWDPAISEVTSDAIYTATFVATPKAAGDYLDIVDWTASTLTINANGWAIGGWPYSINGTAYYADEAAATAAGSENFRAPDRTLTIPYSGAAGSELDIMVKSADNTIISKHSYAIPYINTVAGAGEDAFVYIRDVTNFAIDATSVSHIATLSIRPEASVSVTDGTLAVDSLVLRTLPWQAAAIRGNITASKTYYTRIAPNNRTISGLGGPISYVAARYYQFALPLNCTVAVKDIKVTHGAKTTYGKAWLIKNYDEASRAEHGAGDNWNALNEGDYIQGGVGYEMASNSEYYREYLFPVNTAELGTNTAVSYDLGAAGVDHAGWNIVVSPLMSVYDNTDADPESGLKVSQLMTDGSYDQGIPEYIYPAIPFTYQASEGQTQISFAENAIVASAPRRRVAASEEQTRLQWIHLDVKDANGVGDHTSVLSHPTRYEQTYKTGIDVAKQSLEATRALIYSSHAYGEMAFAGVSDALLEKGVALTVYSPSEQELTFSLRENNWLDRMAYVWLVDTETDLRTDLLTQDYRYDANAGTTEGRFILQGVFKAPQGTTDIENGEASDNKAKARKLIIRDKMYIMVNDLMYDATGKKVK